jgi:hypothetical protein
MCRILAHLTIPELTGSMTSPEFKFEISQSCVKFSAIFKISFMNKKPHQFAAQVK